MNLSIKQSTIAILWLIAALSLLNAYKAHGEPISSPEALDAITEQITPVKVSGGDPSGGSPSVGNSLGDNSKDDKTGPGKGERLIAEIPKDWVRTYQINTETTRLSDFVPSEENAANWTLKLSFEAYSAKTLTIDPIELLLSEATADEVKCNFVQHFNIFSGYENNYETSVRLFLCGENEFANKGEIKLAKAIRGNEFIYSVRLTKRIPPFDLGQETFSDDEMAKWSGYLNLIKLCDDDPAHLCSPKVRASPQLDSTSND